MQKGNKEGKKTDLQLEKERKNQRVLCRRNADHKNSKTK